MTPISRPSSIRDSNFLLRALGIAALAGLAVGLFVGIRYFI